MNESTQELAIARDEAIFFYGPDGRGPAYGLDGNAQAETRSTCKLSLTKAQESTFANTTFEPSLF